MARHAFEDHWAIDWEMLDKAIASAKETRHITIIGDGPESAEALKRRLREIVDAGGTVIGMGDYIYD